MLLQLFQHWNLESELNPTIDISHFCLQVDLWDVPDIIKDAMEDTLIWWLSTLRSLESTMKTVNHIEIMTSNARPHVSLKAKSGESQIMVMLVEVTMEAPMNRL